MDKVNEEGNEDGLLTALPSVPDDELLVVAHRSKDVLVVVVPGHILRTANAHQTWATSRSLCMAPCMLPAQPPPCSLVIDMDRARAILA